MSIIARVWRTGIKTSPTNTIVVVIGNLRRTGNSSVAARIRGAPRWVAWTAQARKIAPETGLAPRIGAQTEAARRAETLTVAAAVPEAATVDSRA